MVVKCSDQARFRDRCNGVEQVFHGDLGAEVACRQVAQFQGGNVIADHQGKTCPGFDGFLHLSVEFGEGQGDVPTL